MAGTTAAGTANPFLKPFSGKEPRAKQAMWATLMLQEMLDRPKNEKQAELWGQALQSLTGSQLAAGFHAAALTVRGWPTLADVLDPILEEEYAEGWQWLMRGIERYGTRWVDRQAVYGDRWRKPGAAIDEWEPGKLVEPFEPAPIIPSRLAHALEIAGGGNMLDGLSFVGRHPAAHQGTPNTSGDPLREKFQIEREFKAAWMAVRKRELREVRLE
jgi:hypothetical protein